MNSLRPWWLSKNPKNDKRWRNAIFGIFGILFLLAIAGLFRNLAYGQETDKPPMKLIVALNPIYLGIYPGDIARLEITNIPEGARNWGLRAWTEFDGKVFYFFWHQNSLIALVPIPLDQRPDKINFAVFVEGGGYKFTEPAQIEVGAKTWPEKRMPDYPPLNPEQLARLAKEKASINKALGKTASYKIWVNPFQSPLSEMIETSPFGQKRINSTKTRQHRGADFRAVKGAPVRVMNDGYVVLTGKYLFDGGIVVIDHGLGLQTLYLHMSRVLIKRGQFVKRGQVIGYAGDTGIAYGSHLHLEVRLNGEPVNPLQILEILK